MSITNPLYHNPGILNTNSNLKDNWGTISANASTTKIVDHQLHGFMSYVSWSLDEEEKYSRWGGVPDDVIKKEIKKELLNRLAEELMYNNQVEFTSQPDITTGTIHYRARVYAVPDTQVKIVRELVNKY
jgi:hypothetical protein